MREYEQKVASIHAWVIATKAENDELRKEVKRITGEHTHLQESVIKPLENVLVPVGLYSHQSYAACVTALREANADLIQRAEDAERALAEARYFLKYKDKAPGDEPGAGSVQQGMKIIQDSI